MKCLFIGGPLDGELREVPEDYCPCRDCGGYVASLPGYAIANGIARHESVSEEEVARRVHSLMTLLESRMGLP